mmetsp:Transcript_12835/g.14441  ORF Transcript_12835/g.14441 Transcript_12835/m.14441 type:complete len:92 (-) Transcript_12835:332-607(-)
MLRGAGFVDIQVVLKEESKEFIKDWLPGSGCENYVISANITATKPGPALAKEEGKQAEAEDVVEDANGFDFSALDEISDGEEPAAEAADGC